MKLPIDPLIQLLHSASQLCLATHSTQLDGFPYATALPFALDAQQRPLILISQLAEHTRNLLADGRASLLLNDDLGAGVLQGARLTLLGEMTQVDVSAEVQARYLRYLPDAARYLALGDFRFFRMAPQRARYIGGFGQMGWVEADSWHALPMLQYADETALLERLGKQLPAHVALLGLDCFGLDLRSSQQRLRLPFASAAHTPEQVLPAAQRVLAEWLGDIKLHQPLAGVTAYLTKDGSQIRELMHPQHHGNRNQSLAEATVAAGQRTALHRHWATEELYHITTGRGLMTLGKQVFAVAAGDTVQIPPGTPHCIEADNDGPLTLLCCCSPAYAHDDTELLES